MAAGFQMYNQYGALTIDSENKSIATSQYLGNLPVRDVGSVIFNGGTDFGNGSTLGWLTSPLPQFGMRWWRPLANGGWGMPGGSLFTPNSGDFMITSPNTGLASGYLDVYSASGQLVWSAASAGTMPRIMDFIDIPAGHNLASTITKNTSFANPWICISQCPGNSSEAGEGTGGYSGVIIRRNNAQSLSIQYINRNQKNYNQAMGSNSLRICLAYFTGY